MTFSLADVGPIEITEADRARMNANCLAEYDRVSHVFIDKWPESVRALSMPTKLVSIDTALMKRLWDDGGDFSAHHQIAATLDSAMGWENWFIRLNSRSPKDASYPAAPVTCAGKQAVSWIAASERCLDDTVLMHNAGKPLFVCLREWRYMHEDGEFRCFAKGGRLIGVTRYFYHTEAQSVGDDAALWEAAEAFYEQHIAALYPEIVFDLYDPLRAQPLLIEINPYGLSDPCLFGSYAALEANPGVRQRMYGAA